MKRRFFALLTALVLVFSLTACNTPAGSQSSAGGSSTPPPSSSVSTPDVSQPETPSVYMDIPQEYRSWDEDGHNINFERLATAENGMVAALRYEPAQIGSDIMEAVMACR